MKPRSLATVDTNNRDSTVDYNNRQPPQDMAAEQAVLGGMLLGKDAIADVLVRLRPGDFYRPAHPCVGNDVRCLPMACT